jgi:hypothetical protein
MARHAFMVNAGPDDVGSMANALQYALSLDDAGHDAAVYLDGPATQWPREVERLSDHPVADYLEAAQRRGLLAGACAFCADAFDGTRGCERAGIDLLGSPDTHGPDVARLVEDGFELHTVG